jgi:hypothetical protein
VGGEQCRNRPHGISVGLLEPDQQVTGQTIALIDTLFCERVSFAWSPDTTFHHSRDNAMVDNAKTTKTEPEQKAPPSLIDSVEGDAKTVKLVVLTTIVCVCIFAGLVYSVFLTPEWIVKRFKLTDAVINEISQRVDSGYSTTVIFQNKSYSGNALLDFYCTENQHVSLSVHSTPVDFPRGITPTVRVFLDGAELQHLGGSDSDLPNTQEIIEIDHFLSGDQSKVFHSGGRRLHNVRIVTDADQYPHGKLVVDLLLLVSNATIKN